MPGRSSEFSASAAGEAEEEQKLAEQCRSSSYFGRTKLIKVMMTLSSVQLVTEQTGGLQAADGDQKPWLSGMAFRNVLRPVAAWPEYRPKGCSRPDASSFGRRLVWPPMMSLLTVLFLHYAIVRLLPLSILSLERHLILSHLKPSVQPQAQRTNSCALSKDLYFSKPVDAWAQLEQLKHLDAWLKFLGVNMVSLPELSVTVLFIVAIVPLAYHHMWQLFLSRNRFRSDTLCFILDPLGERQRLSAELRNIIREMIMFQSNHKNNLYYGFENSKALQDTKPAASGLRSVRRPQASTISDGFEDPDQHRRLLDNHHMLGRIRYLQTLVKIRPLKHVDPYIVTSNWHRTLLRQTDFLKMYIYFAYSFATLAVLCEILYDLCDATRLRLQVIECTKWHPQGTRVVALDHLYLDELNSMEQLDAYKAYDGSALSFLKLALLIESSSYFSLRRVACWIEDLLAGCIIGIELLLGLVLHLASTSEKIVWLQQLDQQVDRAANEAAEHAHLARRFGPAQDSDERLLNTLTLVYLNYELFRRQQDEYLKLTDRITACLTLATMMICSIIYYTGVSLGTSSPVLVFSFCLPLLAAINLFLVTGSYWLKQMEKITVKATRILAHCSSGPIQLSYPVDLWRRQVLAFAESQRRYAARLLGIRITYETVISMNGYAIALLLILLKPQRSPLN